MNYPPTFREKLLEIADLLIKQDKRLIPLDGTKKQPFFPALPIVTKDDGTPVLNQYGKPKRSWRKLAEQGQTTIEMVENWLDMGATGLGVVCGELGDGLYAFDVDDMSLFEPWMASTIEVGGYSWTVREYLEMVGVPLQISGSGKGCQFWVISEEGAPRSTGLAYVPNQEEKSGREIGIETIGAGQYITSPYSRHPSGGHYRPTDEFGGSFEAIPVISREAIEAIENAARALCQAPKSRQQIEREKREAKRRAERKNRPQYERRSGPSVIDRFNQDADIEDMLTSCGYYKPLNAWRWVPPGAKKPSVEVTTDNKSVHYSTNDPMSDSYPKTPFDLFCHYNHNGDKREAVKAAAVELGMDYASQRRSEQQKQPQKPQASEKQAANDKPHAPSEAKNEKVVAVTLEQAAEMLNQAGEFFDTLTDPASVQLAEQCYARLDAAFVEDDFADVKRIFEEVREWQQAANDLPDAPEVSAAAALDYWVPDEPPSESEDFDIGFWVPDLTPPPPPPNEWYGEVVAEPTPNERDNERDKKLQATSSRVIVGNLIAVREPLPDWPTRITYATFDWNGFKREIVSKFSVADYVKKEFNAKAANHITVNEARNRFETGLGVRGGVFEIVCWKMFGSTDTKEHWSQVLREAARFADVEYPDFRMLGCTFHDVLRIAQKEADNFYVIVLEDDQYLSDVLDYNELAWGKVTHVIAGCGIGKSYATDNVRLKSLYTPMSRQAETFAKGANKREDERGVEERSQVIIQGFGHDGESSIFGTYDAASKEMTALNEGKLKLKGRTCFLDEVPHMNHDGYRNSTALRPVLKISKRYLAEGGRVVTLSGTPSPAYASPLSYTGSDVIYVTRKKQAKKKMHFFKKSDSTEAIVEIKAKGFTHITYSMDDKEKCEAASATLTDEKSIKSRPLHSKNKKAAFHRLYTGMNGEDGKWEKGIEAYVTTRATVDGFSVKIGNVEDAQLAEMFDPALQYGSQMIEQRSKRIRDHGATLFVGLTEEAITKVGKGGHFDFMDELKTEQERAEIVFGAAKALHLYEVSKITDDKNVDEANEAARKYVVSQFKGWVIFDENGEIEIDHLAINQRITARWVAASHANPDIMANELGAYGYELEVEPEKQVADLAGDVESAEERKATIKATKKAKKEAELTGVKEQAETMSIDQARAVSEKPRETIKEDEENGVSKVAAASYIVELTEKGVTVEEAKRQIAALTSTSKRNFKRIDNKIRLAKVRRAMRKVGDDFDDPKTRFLAILQNGKTFKVAEQSEQSEQGGEKSEQSEEKNEQSGKKSEQSGQAAQSGEKSAQSGEKSAQSGGKSKGGDVLTTSEITERVRMVAEKCGIPEIMVPLTIKEKKRKKKNGERYDSDRRIIQLVSDMYVLRRTQRKVGDQIVRVYEFKKQVEIELVDN